MFTPKFGSGLQSQVGSSHAYKLPVFALADLIVRPDERWETLQGQADGIFHLSAMDRRRHETEQCRATMPKSSRWCLPSTHWRSGCRSLHT